MPPDPPTTTTNGSAMTTPSAPSSTPSLGTSALARAFGGSLFAKTLFDNRRVLIAWALATGLLAMMYAAFYPQISADSLASVPEAMRGFGLDDATSAAALPSRARCSVCSFRCSSSSTVPPPAPA